MTTDHRIQEQHTGKPIIVLDAEGNQLEPLAEMADRWVHILASRLGDRTKRALLRVCSGIPVREAAIAEGYAYMGDIQKQAKVWHLIDHKTVSLIHQQREVSQLAAEELKRRLMTAPEDISGMVLNAIAGTATDKVLAYEKTAEIDGSSYISALEALAKTVQERGLTIEVAIRPAGGMPGRPTIAAGSDEVVDIEPDDRHSIELSPPVFDTSLSLESAGSVEKESP